MKHFVRVVMEKQELAKQLDESVFPSTNLYETAQGATVYEIPLSRQLTEEESDEYAQRLANYMFEQGYEDFDIEVSSSIDEEIDEETYDDDDEFFEQWSN